MGANSADPNERANIRRLASDPATVRVTRTAEYDMLAHHLTKDDVCDMVIVWIDSGERVKKVTLRGRHAGQMAFEMKPRVNNTLFYLKVTVCDYGRPAEYLLIVSAHPPH